MQTASSVMHWLVFRTWDSSIAHSPAYERKRLTYLLGTGHLNMHQAKRSMLPLNGMNEFRMLTEYDGPTFASTSFTTCLVMLPALPRCPRAMDLKVLPSVLSSPVTPEQYQVNIQW